MGYRVEKRREPSPAGHSSVENSSEPYQILGMSILGAPYLVVKFEITRYRCLPQNRHQNGDPSVYIRSQGGCRQGGGPLKRQSHTHVAADPVAFYEWESSPDPEAHLDVVQAQNLRGDLRTNRGERITK